MLKIYCASSLMVKNVNRQSSASLASWLTNWAYSHSHIEAPEDVDKRFVDFFNRPDLDGWLVRKGLMEVHQTDFVPNPDICSAVLRACRRINDFALCVRFLETVKYKCGYEVKQYYPYIIQEIQPVLDELGISTPEELGYDKPEFYVPDLDHWDWKGYPDAEKPERMEHIYKAVKQIRYDDAMSLH